MQRFTDIFLKPKRSVIGMIHVLSLPGTPFYGGDVQKIVDHALTETEIYLSNDIDSIMVENMHDIPYIQSKRFQPETVAVMTKICNEVRKLVPVEIPLGLQILAGGNKEAIAVAQATNFQYIRAEGFVFGHVGDEGYMDANAGDLLRYRKYIGADNLLIFTDIKKKHSSHSITSDVSLVETAKAAEFFKSDGIILTGSATGEEANEQEFRELKQNCTLPIIIGSGITKDNFVKYLDADAFIIGSHFKESGKWENKLCKNRIKELTKKVKSIDCNKH